MKLRVIVPAVLFAFSLSVYADAPESSGPASSSSASSASSEMGPHPSGSMKNGPDQVPHHHHHHHHKKK